MPVQRFRDFDEARRALWTHSRDPDLARRIRALWARASRLSPPMIPRGLRKFRNIEEANLEREEWVAARVRRIAARRGPNGAAPRTAR